MSARLCLFGAGGHGRVVAAQIQARQPQIELCFGDGRRELGSRVNGIAVCFGAADQVVDASLIVTIGDNLLRAHLQAQAVAAGVSIGRFIADPESWFAPEPGAGTMVLAGAIATSDSRIGDGVIVNSGAIVEHDCDIGDFCHLGPGCVLTGGVALGEHVLVGAGARIINKARIAADTIIGAGATVVSEIDEAGVYVGVPARRIGPVPGEKRTTKRAYSLRQRQPG